MHAIGLIESNSIAKGIELADIMLKTANVKLLVAKSICPGKYIALIGGDVSSVQQSVAAALLHAPSVIVDDFVIANIHPLILPAISGNTIVEEIEAIGILETYSVAVAIEAIDLAVKAASVIPMRIHLAFGIGGKSCATLTGDVAAVQASIDVAAELASKKGFLVNKVVIPRPHPQLIDTLL